MIHFHKPIRLQIGRSMREQPDIHARLMSHYPQGMVIFLSKAGFLAGVVVELNRDIRHRYSS